MATKDGVTVLGEAIVVNGMPVLEGAQWSEPHPPASCASVSYESRLP
jgi:hypothetical protein